MTDLVPTFVNEGNQIFAFFEDRVIAKGTDFKQVEQSAVDYLDSLGKDRKASARDQEKSAATHITTPNGVKGRILGRVSGVWGEQQYTVRLDNGRHIKLEAHGGNDDHLTYTSEIDDAPATPIDALQKELDADFGRDVDSLTARVASLKEIMFSAGAHIAKGASLRDSERLDKIYLAAQHEEGEVLDALAYLEQADAEQIGYRPPVHAAVEQAEMGHAKGDSWLDKTAQDMIAESEGIDFDKMLAEEPALFTASLETGTLADAGIVQELATSHIMAKTAAFAGDEVGTYREQFVAAVEMTRRAELADRQTENHKQAAVQEEENQNFPDAALFMGR